MELTLPTKKIIQTYKRYSLPTDDATPAEQTLQFVYIGTHNRYIDMLKTHFEYGYTTGSTESALFTLQRLLKKKTDVTVPDVIMAEGSLGTEQLLALHRFLQSHKILADVPFIVEATGLSKNQLATVKGYAFVDDIILLNEFTGAELAEKINFLKKIKHKRVHEPATCTVETSFPVFADWRSFFKRVLDVTFSALLLLVLGPVMLLIALAVKLESNGPVLAVTKRTGRGYRIFDCYRFRTITVPDADDNHYHATRIGLFLRKTSLDELPQLMNVLLGDMSLVGNRPLPLHEAARFTTDEWAKRFMSPVGITGLWHIQKRGKDVMSAEECISLDNDYADKSDLLYDFWMMANTPQAIAQKRNA
jgi:lipopolysaccharide/colanic/teichoic acid biosynthesis glycosyltransferase